jgi:hypothetical protein
MQTVVILSGIHPGEASQNLLMRDFNQEFVVGKVLKPRNMPKSAFICQCFVRLSDLEEGVYDRLVRRYTAEQLTDFFLDENVITGKITKIECIENSNKDDKKRDAKANKPTEKVMRFIIDCHEEAA